MKIPLGTRVYLLGCHPDSGAAKAGFKLRDVGWVSSNFGENRCAQCPDPSDCNVVNFVSDAGYWFALCVQDQHIECSTNN